ncbi:glycosyltransferase [Enterobacter cancerogenus]|uniref:glycosyltransferase n=1 Tax=Enterobacter cancerogenus TaxID=69218 RepID=UPI0028B3433C|nr:glycosyltransferase [Enterobacter cancerogenus]MDT7008626.1 glycosyltransferase [Enterobacter cancerogenus]WNN58339.1 glycosyltransferase [Enterobacter cancerogenus]
MKITYLLNQAVLSGPNIVALTNAQELYKNGCEISICFLKRGDDLSKYYPFLKNVEVKYFDTKRFWLKYKLLLTYIKSAQPKIIHSHCFLPDFYNALIKCKLMAYGQKHLSTIHNIPRQDYTIRYGYLKGMVLLFVHRIILSFLHFSVCISKTVQENVNNKSTCVIYNPVRDAFFNSTRAKSFSLRLIYCGHFSELKNPMKIVDSLSKIDMDFHFIGLGDGSLLDACKDSVKNDSRFEFLGRVNNVADYYNKANCLIHFSQTEGFCLSVSEALASGMYVITNDLPIFHELKKRLNAENFYILDAFNSDNLKAILDEISQKIFSGDTSCYDISKKMQSILSSSVTAEEHMHLYKKIINE